MHNIIDHYPAKSVCKLGQTVFPLQFIANKFAIHLASSLTMMMMIALTTVGMWTRGQLAGAGKSAASKWLLQIVCIFVNSTTALTQSVVECRRKDPIHRSRTHGQTDSAIYSVQTIHSVVPIIPVVATTTIATRTNIIYSLYIHTCSSKLHRSVPRQLWRLLQKPNNMSNNMCILLYSTAQWWHVLPMAFCDDVDLWLANWKISLGQCKDQGCTSSSNKGQPAVCVVKCDKMKLCKWTNLFPFDDEWQFVPRGQQCQCTS